MRKIFFIAIFSICFYVSNGQSLEDMLRYSTYEYNGTARHIGVGSAMGPLGADYGAIANNPAAIGTYRRSEFMFTPGVWIRSNETSFTDMGSIPTNVNESRFSILNFGAVFAIEPGRFSKWKRFNVGIGFTNLKNFAREINVRGTTPGSIVDRFVELSDGLPPSQLDPFEAGPAFDAFATFVDDNQNLYGSDVAFGELIFKDQRIEEEGAINEMNISFGGNYDEVIMWGVTFGIPFMKFTQRKSYLENSQTNPVFNNLLFNEFLDASAIGFNIKGGVIIKPVPAFSIAASFHTPSWYAINENFNTDITYDYIFDPDLFPEEGPQTALSPNGSFDYNISTPWRFTGGMGWIIKRSGFISAEVEYVDYANSSFNLTKNSNNFQGLENALNDEINTFLTNAVNLRVGTEWTIDKMRLRAGVQWTGSPIEAEDTRFLAYSAGVGYRGDNFFLDLAYRIAPGERYDYTLYGVEQFPATFVNSDQTTHLIALTAGFKL
jgi:hypothetical protein